MNKTLGGQSLQRWDVLRMADRKYPWKKGRWSQATFSSNRFFFMLEMWRSINPLLRAASVESHCIGAAV